MGLKNVVVIISFILVFFTLSGISAAEPSGDRSTPSVTIPFHNLSDLSGLLTPRPGPGSTPGGTPVCPASLPVPRLGFTTARNVEGHLLNIALISNADEYPDSLFDCSSSACRFFWDLAYEDGIYVQSGGIPSRATLNVGGIVLPETSRHTAFKIRLRVPDCGLETVSALIPIPTTPTAPGEAPTPTTCSGFSSALLMHTDLPGSDYRSTDLASADPCLCARSCQEDSVCQAFTYTPPGFSGPSAKCWLKNIVPARTSCETCISGIKGSGGSDGRGGECGAPPVPVLSYTRSESTTTADGHRGTIYRFSVDNRNDYASSLFASSPDLPPCGSNPSASRTWVSVYNQDDTYLYGFCALSSPSDLASLSFTIPEGDPVPSSIYVTVQDRKCNLTSRSRPLTIPGTSGTGGSGTICRAPPVPVLSYTRSESTTTADGHRGTIYWFSVDNRNDYASSLFASSPDLPPCGSNPSASRTWVSVFNQDDTNLYGFCALSSPSDLASLSFTIPEGDPVPSSIYVTVQDRKCNLTSRSRPLAIPGTSGTGGSGTICRAPPVPVLSYTRSESTTTADGHRGTIYWFSVDNRNDYASSLFASSPDLPPCGSNPSASRTWVSVYNQDGTNLYGFCALNSPSDLTSLSFTIPEGDPVPSSIYITVQDRKCNLTSRSRPLTIPGTSGTGGSGTICRAPPVPVLSYTRNESTTTADGHRGTIYWFSVDNRNDYESSLFTSSPDLPPCGSNPSASRTWVSVYNQDGTNLYGFCALNSPSDLTSLSFTIPEGDPVPSSIYITVQDRKCNLTSRSRPLTIPRTSGTGGSGTICRAPPVPVLSYTRSESTTTADGHRGTIYWFSVDNRNDYASSLFTSSPDLPPCGSNPSASRTWVSVFSQDGTNLYGFCALSSSSDLASLSFTIPEGDPVPSSIYITVQDRKCNLTSRSRPLTIPGTSSPGRAVLPAPVQISPEDRATFNNYPRDITFKWNPVSGAASYTLEVDCFHCCVSNRWCTDTGDEYLIKPGITGTSYEIQFVGKQDGRWRVWAVDSSGNEGTKSPWRVFTYQV